jgi:hypothetical protein
LGEIAPKTRFILSTGWGAQIDPTTVVARGGEGLLPKLYRLHDLLGARWPAPPYLSRLTARPSWPYVTHHITAAFDSGALIGQALLRI